MIGKQMSLEELRKRGIVTDEALGLLASTAAMRWPNRIFLCFENHEYTYSTFSNHVDRTAADFLQNGLKPGHRMFIQSDNTVGTLITIMACWRIGIVPVPAISAYRHHELLQILGDTRPEAVATTEELRGRYYLDEFDELLAELELSPIARYIVDGPCGKENWKKIPDRDDAAGGASIDLPLPPDSSSTALILFTSGTTSRPKGVQISASAIITNTRNWIHSHGLTETHTWFAAWPLAHIGALSTAVFTPLMVGAKSVISRTWIPEEAIHTIAKHHVHILAGSTIFLHDLINAYKNNSEVRYRIPVVGVGGSMTAPELIEAADEMGIKAFRSFGMTELSGVAALARPDDPLRLRSGYDGQVNLGTQIDIADESRRSIGFGELGEIRVRGPHNLLSYTCAEATAEAIDDDGWLYTGDIGLIEANGWMKVVGRKKDIINRGGEKFSSSDIENALMSHNTIDQAAVLGVPDERFGEQIAAFLVLSQGCEWSGPEQVLDHLENLKLAKIKRPVVWHVLAELPRTATGKIQKNLLLDIHKDQSS